jgi:hypothetical protein
LKAASKPIDRVSTDKLLDSVKRDIQREIEKAKAAEIASQKREK